MGTHLRVLGESYPKNTDMTGFRWFPKIFVRPCTLDESNIRIGRVNHNKQFKQINSHLISEHIARLFHCSYVSVFVEDLESDRTVILAAGILVEVEFEEVLGCHGLPSHRTFVVSLQPRDYIPEMVNQTLKSFDIKNTYRLGMPLLILKWLDLVLISF